MPASCLVLDIRLPGMSGLDFQAELARANIDIPVIFITGYADIPMAVRAMKAGAVDFLTKPFREQDMFGRRRDSPSRRDRMRRGKRKGGHPKCGLGCDDAECSRARGDGSGDARSDEQGKWPQRPGSRKRLVKMHRGQAMRKMGATSVVDLVKMAEILGDELNSDFCRSPNIQSEAQARKRRLPNTILSSNVAIERHG